MASLNSRFPTFLHGFLQDCRARKQSLSCSTWNYDKNSWPFTSRLVIIASTPHDLSSSFSWVARKHFWEHRYSPRQTTSFVRFDLRASDNGARGRALFFSKFTTKEQRLDWAWKASSGQHASSLSTHSAWALHPRKRRSIPTIPACPLCFYHFDALRMHRVCLLLILFGIKKMTTGATTSTT